MSLITALALVVIVLAGLYMLALGAASLFAPLHAGRFLLGFASTRSVHLAELLARLVVGAAFVHYAPHMRFSSAFSFFGWALLLTTACLLVMPWEWHRRFAQRAVPNALRFIVVIGLVSLSLATAVFFAVINGQAT